MLKNIVVPQADISHVYSTGLGCSGLIPRVVRLQLSAESLHVMGASQSIAAANKYDEA